MHFIILLSASLAALSLAAPTKTTSDSVHNFFHDLDEYYAKAHRLSRTAAHPAACKTKNITLPSFASGLPAPSHLRLLHVAVGRGTQNYTCNTSSPDTAPKAIGAKASLYNAACIAAKNPGLMNTLPNVVYKSPVPKSSSDSLPPFNIPLLGNHYFRDRKTPVFDLDTSAEKYGIVVTEKQNSIKPPPDAVQGENGAVAWLYLTSTNATEGNYKSVYRVQTTGGQPPKVCKHMPSTFTVQYAANYYFYG